MGNICPQCSSVSGTAPFTNNWCGCDKDTRINVRKNSTRLEAMVPANEGTNQISQSIGTTYEVNRRYDSSEETAPPKVEYNARS